MPKFANVALIFAFALVVFAGCSKKATDTVPADDTMMEEEVMMEDDTMMEDEMYLEEGSDEVDAEAVPEDVMVEEEVEVVE